MADLTDLAQAAIALTDPNTSAEDLATIAQVHPNLRVGVARHPNAYPGLLTWLSENGDDETRAAVAQRTAPVASSIPPPPVPSQAEPTPSHKPPIKRNRLIVIIIAAVVVIALIVVGIVVFTKKDSGSGSGPTLSPDQLNFLAVSLAGDPDEIETGIKTSDWLDCPASSWWPDSLMAFDGQHGQSLPGLDDMYELFTGLTYGTTPDQVVSDIMACVSSEAQDAGASPFPSKPQSTGGVVWQFLRVPGTETEGVFWVASYGNVLFMPDDLYLGGQPHDDNILQQRGQAWANRLKSLVDVAAAS